MAIQTDLALDPGGTVAITDANLELVGAYMLQLRNQSRHTNETLDAYEASLKSIARSLGASGVRIRTATTSDLRQWWPRQRSVLSMDAIARQLSLLHQVYVWYSGIEGTPRNNAAAGVLGKLQPATERQPNELARRPRKHLPRVLSPSERELANQWIESAQRMQDWMAVRDAAMLALVLYAALKPGEVRELTLDQLAGQDIERATWESRPTRLILANREVPLNVHAQSALHAWLDMRVHIGNGERVQTSRTVFLAVASRDGAMDPSVFHARWETRRAQMLLNHRKNEAPMQLHALRYTAIVMALALAQERGEPADPVFEAAGLMDPKTRELFKSLIPQASLTDAERQVDRPHGVTKVLPSGT